MDPHEKHKQAIALDDNGESEKALAVIDEGLAASPKYLPLLRAKGDLLLKLRDYSGALAAYQRYIEAGATGAIARDVQNIIRSLSAVRTTFLDIEVANGPAEIYLDSKTLGVFCAAAPSCHQAVMPGGYKVIADRPGFERWVGRVTVEPGTTQKLAVALVEKLSELTVRASPGGARIRVGDKDYDAPMMIAAGSHPVTVTLAGHAPTRVEAIAHEGKPVVLEVTLAPLLPIRMEPPTATLQLDGGRVLAVQDGGVVLPPGKQVVVGRAQGFQDRRVEVPAERPVGYRVDVELERIVPPPPPPPAPSPFTPRRKIAIGVAGFGVASAVLGAIAWDDKKRHDEYIQKLCPSSTEPCRNAVEADKLQEVADRRRDETYLGYGVAAAAIAAAAALWVTGAPESPVAVSARVGPVTGLDLSVRF
ncbi:MAG TPA: PEGA domain-containing protein [Kofleriaceae bacterium]